MSSWLSRLLGIRRSATKTLQRQVQNNVQPVTPNLETKIEAIAASTPKSNAPSLGSQLSYGKWYYGVDTKAQPTIRRFTGGIEKRYSCKNGGEVVVTYVSSGDKSSSLDIVKVGNEQDTGRGDWFKSLYSYITVRHYKDRYNFDAAKTIKKKGAIKQILSSQNGRATDDVHVPLKRWEISKERCIGSGKKIDNQINSRNPNDFNRFCD